MPLRRKRHHHIDVPVADFVLRITGPDELYEEVRAAGLQFWEQLQSYGIRNPDFRASRRPISIPENAPAAIRELAGTANRAGVGPMFTLTGALVDYVGLVVGKTQHEFMITCGRDQYVVARKRSRLTVRKGLEKDEGNLAVVVKPELGPHGIYSSLAAEPEPGHVRRGGLAIVANSCTMADAAAAGARSILSKPDSLKRALDYLRRLQGVHGAIIVLGEHIGVAGGLELAA
jgi:uncharacterized protein